MGEKTEKTGSVGSSINLNYELTRQNFVGRDLSKFDEDILKILCAVLNNTGPVRFTEQDVIEIDTNELVIEHNAAKKAYIVMMVAPHEGMNE